MTTRILSIAFIALLTFFAVEAIRSTLAHHQQQCERKGGTLVRTSKLRDTCIRAEVINVED